ncbi:ATP-dependent DNA ligase [Microbacterium sp. C5A9]|uniref:DUF7882 family protein n=1 Tax=Microbacterium sp. C5A9 TaxID=2736663 RepID=UPI001F5274C9|nr:ATP-dependent DNA ligase [Microbacterium sp. C5A9]MCI1019521.1 ATP-dependent DNA ligase [Microbacterium sp. C5A9]
MGRFTYNRGPRVHIEDRALDHLQLVMTAKLRRGEPFAFTWRDDLSLGGGRTTVWVHPASALAFSYTGTRSRDINRDWLRDLAVTASQPGGLYLTPEPVR